MDASLLKMFLDGIQNDPAHCVLFVGAGLSKFGVRPRGHGLPDWYGLMKAMIEHLGTARTCDDAELTSLKRSLKKKRSKHYLRIAEVFRKHTADDEFATFLRIQLDPKDIRPSKIHELILDAGFFGIITTNFDCVFESQSFSLNPLVYPQCLTALEAFQRPGFFAKIHGCVRLTERLRENLILTQTSYNLLRENERYQSLLRAIFLGRPILTVGCSLSDPDFLGVVDHLKSIFGGDMRSIYALTSKPETVDMLAWREKGVIILPYDNHRELLGFFRGVAQVQYPRRTRLALHPAFKFRVRDVKKEARSVYEAWTEVGSVSPRFKKVTVNRKGWRHITRVSRPQREVCHKLSLLHCAQQLIRDAHTSTILRVIESPKRPFETREFHSLQGVYRSTYRSDALVEVILEVSKLMGVVQDTTFLTVHELRRHF